MFFSNTVQLTLNQFGSIIVIYTDEKGIQMELKVGNKITWNSAAGDLAGIIYNISLSDNAKNETTAWIDVSLGTHSVRLCGNHSNLTMLQVAKI